MYKFQALFHPQCRKGGWGHGPIALSLPSEVISASVLLALHLLALRNLKSGIGYIRWQYQRLASSCLLTPFGLVHVPSLVATAPLVVPIPNRSMFTRLK